MCGFAIGFLIDSALLQTLGVSSLALLTAGYLAGRYREGFDVTSPLVPPLLAGALTLLATGGFAVVQLMLGVDAPVSLLVLRELARQGRCSASCSRSRSTRSSAAILRAALVEDSCAAAGAARSIPFRTA